MYTRQNYLNKKCSHREYYSQFVNEAVRRRVQYCIPKDKLLACKDLENFNDIPLAKWDMILTSTFLGLGAIKKKLKEAGDSSTLAGLVCIAKEAAKQIVENEK
jgi:hypothetical protein